MSCSPQLDSGINVFMFFFQALKRAGRNERVACIGKKAHLGVSVPDLLTLDGENIVETKSDSAHLVGCFYVI